MKKNKLQWIKILFAVFVFTFFSAKQPNKHSVIYISYYKGLAETLVPIRCGDIAKIPSESFKVDTIIADSYLVNEIKKQAEIAQKNTSRLFSGCDIRMDCKVFHNNTESMKICIGQLDCIVINGEPVGSNNKLLYLIRKNSGYYNYFNREQLRHIFKELKIYGIPKDYKFRVK